jgi:hypothetical protein
VHLDRLVDFLHGEASQLYARPNPELLEGVRRHPASDALFVAAGLIPSFRSRLRVRRLSRWVPHGS